MFMVRCKIPGGRVTADQYLALDDLAGQLRQRHAALHQPAGHPVPRRPQEPPQGDHRRHQRVPADHARGLRRRGTQRHGLPGPAPPRRRPRRAAGDRRPPGRPPGAAHRRLPRNLAQRQAGERKRETGDRTTSSRSTARSICRASSRPAWPCPRTTASTSTPRTSACWPSSRTAAIAGYNVLVGGGMGMTHGNANTFPYLAKPICYVPAAVGGARRPRRSSSCSATTATAPTASAPASSTSSTTGASRSSARCWPATSAAPLTLPRPVEVSGFDLHLGWHAAGRRQVVLRPERRERPRQGRGVAAAALRPARHRRALPAGTAPDAAAGHAAVRPGRRRPARSWSSCCANTASRCRKTCRNVQQLQHGLPGHPDVRPGHLRGGACRCRASSTSWKRS